MVTRSIALLCALVIAAALASCASPGSPAPVGPANTPLTSISTPASSVVTVHPTHAGSPSDGCVPLGDDASPETYPNLACAPEADQTPGITVGAVPGQSNATAALQAWANDFAVGDISRLQSKCWTISPARVNKMYARTDAIRNAITQPGLDGQFAYIWQDDSTRVGVKRSEIASGYACPYVSPRSDVHIYNGEDARYVVQRYVQRIWGKPVNAADTEDRYRIECRGLTDTARAIARTMTQYEAGSMQVSGGPDQWSVVVPGKSSGGDPRTYRFSTSIEDEGYCIQNIE